MRLAMEARADARLVAAFGIGADVAAEALIVLGDKPRTDSFRSAVRSPVRR